MISNGEQDINRQAQAILELLANSDTEYLDETDIIEALGLTLADTKEGRKEKRNLYFALMKLQESAEIVWNSGVGYRLVQDAVDQE